MKGLTWVYFGDLEKSRDDNGNLIVKGVATSSRIDSDEQICEPEWLQKAVDEWFRTGANMRLMHDKKAVGKGIELEWDPDGKAILTSKCVDEATQKLIDEDVLTGMSIGIRNARVIKSDKAKGGLICGGKIPEISYVDRPANYDALIMKGLGFGEDPQWQDVTDPDLKQVLRVLDIMKSEGMADDGTDDDSNDDFECSDCNDTAWLSPGIPCPSCNADGNKSVEGDTTFASITDEYGFDYALEKAAKKVNCPTCDGDGKIKGNSTECPDCDGSGKVSPAKAANLKDKADVPHLEKKKYTLAQRLALAKEGKAMPGGGYPIDDVADLENAIQAIGRAKNPAATKAFIKRRAKALKATDKIPDTWKVSVATEVALDLLKMIPADFDWTKITKGSDADTWLHDPNVCAQISAGLAEMLNGEIAEQVAGEDERWDIQQLAGIWSSFLSWQLNEAYDGETESPFGPQEDDTMDSLISMGVDADLVKAAKADDATPEAKDALKAATIDALGLTDVVADYKAMQAILEKSGSKTLAEELESIRGMAAPGKAFVGPARTDPTLQKGSEAERLTADLYKYRKLAADVSDPQLAATYHTLADEAFDSLMALGERVS
jgi:hypothetical protein